MVQNSDLFAMMKFIVWNCRGAVSKGFAAVIKDTRIWYKLDFAVILEPRISGHHANKFVWERDDLLLDALVKDELFFHCRIRMGANHMLLTAVYASPNEQRRRGLWENLQEIVASVTEPWLIAGDFNEIKTPLEQKGGGRVNDTRCRRFNDWIQECDLIDVETKGPFYTWKGLKWEGLDRVYKRLDRCLCNIRWLEKFADAEVRVLLRVCSDHHPILVLVGKYGRQNDLMRRCKVLKSDSEIWKNIARIWPKLTENVCWELGDGRRIKFWHDNWIEGGMKLKNMSSGILPEDAEEVRVADMCFAKNATLLCALKCVVGLIVVACCALLRHGSGASASLACDFLGRVRANSRSQGLVSRNGGSTAREEEADENP
ncbi:hypothetical protein K1719_046429 [Acacia pycnantha]|nr:hypothetical protein K1719_046429 [Acacia pycnantha]